MTVGERGPVGDHGQAGADGRTGPRGAEGIAGTDGKTGPTGPPGSVLSKAQTLYGFAFVVLAFLLLAYIVQQDSGQIDRGVERQDRFLTEICARQPDLAPATCSLPR